MIERAEQDGHPLDSIVQKIEFPSVDDDQSECAPVNPDPRSGRAFSNNLPKLTLAKIKSPAVLIGKDLEIIWQNEMAIEEIWHGTSIMHNGFGSPSVFHILFNANFQSSVENWRQWAAFFLEQGISLSSRQQVQSIIEAQSERCRVTLHALLSEMIPSQERDTVINGRLRLVQTKGRAFQFRVATVDFLEGRLIIFEPDMSMAAEKSPARFSKAAPSAEPLEKPLYFLAACLNKADTLQIEMLPGEYSRLLSLTWQKCSEVTEQFGGTVLQSDGSGLAAFFIPENGLDDQSMSVIQCAMELKSQMTSIGRQWKIRKGWLHNIELNIGLHFSREFIGTINSSSGNHPAPLGPGLQTVTCLSAVATDGEIWASKALIKKLSKDALQHLRFGVFHSNDQRRLLSEHGFARIKDLPRFSRLPVGISEEISSSVIATQLFDTQG